MIATIGVPTWSAGGGSVTLARVSSVPPECRSAVGAIDRSPVESAWAWPAMGGTVSIRIASLPGSAATAANAAARVAHRVGRWAARLTRFDPGSELSRLNAEEEASTSVVGPTLVAVLDWAERATDRCPGIVDVSLLAERLAAEEGRPAATGRPPRGAPDARPSWWLERGHRGGLVHRRRPVRFDLDGVAKGWIADRALALLAAFPAALVDADGDIAVRSAPGLGWCAAVAHPSASRGPELAVLRLPESPEGGSVGVATSGTSVHAWRHGSRWSHHLIDPRTGAPARTDVVQATVMTTSARLAEVIAKSIVIRGSQDGLRLAEEVDVLAVVLLLETGEVLLTEESLPWLA